MRSEDGMRKELVNQSVSQSVASHTVILEVIVVIVFCDTVGGD